MELGGFFRIINHSDFGFSRCSDIFNNIFKLARHFIAVSCFAALTANTGWYIFNNNNAITHIGGKIREAVLYLTLAHKADHVFLQDNLMDTVLLFRHLPTRFPHRLCLYPCGKSAQGYGLTSAQTASGKVEQYPQLSQFYLSMKERIAQRCNFNHEQPEDTGVQVRDVREVRGKESYLGQKSPRG
jgi:hypothetical protein